MTNRRTLFAALGVGLGWAMQATPAAAQAIDDKYWLEVSGYWPSIDTEIQVSSVNNPTIGTEIDLESDLDLADDRGLPAFFAGARLGGGFSIGAEYYSLGRSGTKTLERQITFRDVTYPVAVEVESSFDTDIYRLTVGYAFVRNETVELGAALGLHATDIAVELSGQGSVGGATAQIQSRSEDVLAPLPTLGLFGAWEIAPGFTLNGRVDYLSLKIDQYDGRLVNAQAALTYRFHRNIGIGAAYRYVDYRLDVERERTNGSFEYRFNGPALFVQFGF